MGVRNLCRWNCYKIKNEYPEGVIVADVLDGCGDNLQVTYSDNWKRIINGDLAGGKNGTCKQSIACRKIKALGGTDNCVCTLIVPSPHF